MKCMGYTGLYSTTEKWLIFAPPSLEQGLLYKSASLPGTGCAFCPFRLWDWVNFFPGRITLLQISAVSAWVSLFTQAHHFCLLLVWNRVSIFTIFVWNRVAKLCLFSLEQGRGSPALRSTTCYGKLWQDRYETGHLNSLEAIPEKTQRKGGPCSVVGHVPTLPWVRSRVWVRVGLGSGLATRKGWVGTWPITRLDTLLSCGPRTYPPLA